MKKNSSFALTFVLSMAFSFPQVAHAATKECAKRLKAANELIAEKIHVVDTLRNLHEERKDLIDQSREIARSPASEDRSKDDGDLKDALRKNALSTHRFEMKAKELDDKASATLAWIPVCAVDETDDAGEPASKRQIRQVNTSDKKLMSQHISDALSSSEKASSGDGK